LASILLYYRYPGQPSASQNGYCVRFVNTVQAFFQLLEVTCILQSVNIIADYFTVPTLPVDGAILFALAKATCPSILSASCNNKSSLGGKFRLWYFLCYCIENCWVFYICNKRENAQQ